MHSKRMEVGISGLIALRTSFTFLFLFWHGNIVPRCDATRSANTMLRLRGAGIPNLENAQFREQMGKLKEMVWKEIREKDGIIEAGLDDESGTAGDTGVYSPAHCDWDTNARETSSFQQISKAHEDENSALNADLNSMAWNTSEPPEYWEMEEHEPDMMVDMSFLGKDDKDVTLPDTVSNVQVCVEGASKSGGRVLVRGGVYKWEGAVRVGRTGDKHVQLVGCGRTSTMMKGTWVLEAAAGGKFSKLAFNFTAVDPRLECKVFEGYCMQVNAGTWDWDMCDIRSVKGSVICAQGRSNVTLHGCSVGGYAPRLLHDVLEGMQGFLTLMGRAKTAIQGQDAACVVARDCCIQHTGLRYGHGVSLRGASSAVLHQCTARSNIQVLFLEHMTSASLSACTIAHDNDCAFWVRSDSQQDGKAVGCKLQVTNTSIECEAWFDALRPSHLHWLNNKVCQQDSGDDDEQQDEPQQQDDTDETKQDCKGTGTSSLLEGVEVGASASAEHVKGHQDADAGMRLRGGGDEQEQGKVGGKVYIEPCDEQDEEDESEDRRIAACLKLAEEAGLLDMSPTSVTDTTLPNVLHNRYFALRHGESEANVKGIIVADPFNGLEAYGLTPKGRTQVQKAADSFLQALDGACKEDVLVFTSDFKRTFETARLFAEACAFKPDQVQIARQLRERGFGALELGNHSRYGDVWKLDQQNGEHSEFGVEPARDVRMRTVSLVRVLEAQYKGKVVVLVSHGDALQILQTAFKGIDVRSHRSLQHLEQAEIRELVRSIVPGMTVPGPVAL